MNFSNDQVFRATGDGCADAETAHDDSPGRGSASSTSAATAAPLATFASITTSPNLMERSESEGGVKETCFFAREEERAFVERGERKRRRMKW